MTLFLDLDGPILDVSLRYFRVHQLLVGPARSELLGRDDYWMMKRERTPLAEVLARCGVPGPEVEEYASRWLTEIEAQAQLTLDTIHAGVRDLLVAWRERHQLVLLTLRQHRERLFAQLEHLGLRPMFHHVLSGTTQHADGWETKARLVQSSKLADTGACIVGDTEVDLRAGRIVGLRTVGVLCGIRSRRWLEAERPDHIIADLRQLPAILPL